MRKLVLALILVLAVSGLVSAASVDSKLVDVLKSAKGLIPVIVEMNPGAKHADVSALGGKLKDSWTVINGFSADLPAAAIQALAQNPNVKSISYDTVVNAYMNTAAPAVHADDLWAEGYDGDGVTIAILDTGIYPHADLGARIVGFKDFINSRTAPYDDNGHGTHIAGIAAGAGTTYRGIAPHAKLVGVKVLNSAGSGSIAVIINGINWIVSNKSVYGIKVLSISMGAQVTQSSTTDPLCAAVRSAWNAGIVVCVAAGSSTIGTPGNEPLVITVNACDDNGVLASFAAKGPTPIDGWMKPDCMAPGVSITSLKNASTGYVTMSGSSMSTPIVAGIAAQYLEAYPTRTPGQFKIDLKAACVNKGYPETSQGAGMVDAYYTVH